MMGYEDFLLVVNASSIFMLVIMTMIMLVATNFKGESAYAAVICVAPTVPVYIYNVSRMMGWHDLALFMHPFGYSVNAMLMPLLWIFTLRNFKPGFKLRPILLLHFLPAVILLLLDVCISREHIMENILYEMGGYDMWLGNLNAAVIFAQMVIYFTAIFIYIRKVRKYVIENCSDAEFLQKEWIYRLMILMAVLFGIVMVAYLIYPRSDAWLIQILNCIGMIYLVYNAIAHPTNLQVRCPNSEKGSGPSFNLEEEQMEGNCTKVLDYLIDTKAYLRQDLSLAELSKETGLSQKALSRSINTHLNRSFFELINRMRVDEAKRLLLLPENAGYTVDSIFDQCGFRSRSTFFLAFKRIEGQSPSQWLKSTGRSHSIVS